MPSPIIVEFMAKMAAILMVTTAHAVTKENRDYNFGTCAFGEEGYVAIRKDGRRIVVFWLFLDQSKKYCSTYSGLQILVSRNEALVCCSQIEARYVEIEMPVPP
jgi:hypothetical protein